VSILKIKKTKIIDKDTKAMLLIEAIELKVELNDIYTGIKYYRLHHRGLLR